MAFGISCPVLAPAVGLVDRRTVDLSSSGAGALVVRVDVVNGDGQAAAGGLVRARGHEAMLPRDPVQPYDLASGVDLAVDDAIVIVAVDPTGLQAERAD